MKIPHTAAAGRVSSDPLYLIKVVECTIRSQRKRDRIERQFRQMGVKIVRDLMYVLTLLHTNETEGGHKIPSYIVVR